MNRAWLWILAGGVFETGWAYSMKMSDSFSDIPWTAVTLVMIAVSVLLLNRGLKSGLPMGPCYAVWVGMGAIGSIIIGLVVFGETLNILGWTFLAVIVVGVLGLNLITEPGDTGDRRLM